MDNNVNVNMDQDFQNGDAKYNHIQKRYNVKKELLNINHRLNEYAQYHIKDILYYNTKQ